MFKNLGKYRSENIILLDYQNNYVEISSNAKTFSLETSLSFLHNYFNCLIKLKNNTIIFRFVFS